MRFLIVFYRMSGMNPFDLMLKKTISSPYYDQMLRYAAPLSDHWGINHFWYYKITFSGHYSYLGTHTAWNKFCFEQSLINHFPCLRHPDTLQRGINLMKASQDREYKTVLNVAWEKFRINFNVNILNKIPEGIEAFGFATRFNDTYAEQRLLNDLPLLRHFTKKIQATHRSLFQLLDDNQIDISSQLGLAFYERAREEKETCGRDQLLRRMGFADILSLTVRETEVFKHIASGYPIGYIAQQLNLSVEIVENYIAIIKSKLSCQTGIELMLKAREIASLGYFD